MLRLSPEQTEFVLRSNMCCGSERTTWWWNCYLEATTEEAKADKPGTILLELLRHEDAEVRLQAATAAAYAPHLDEVTCDLLARMAFGSDEDEDTSRAAARSLATKASDYMKKQITHRLKWWRWWHTSKPMLAILGDLYEADQSGNLPLLWRQRAARISRRCKYDVLVQQHPGIQLRGPLTGLMAGVAWASSVGGLFAAWVAWLIPQEMDADKGVISWIWRIIPWVGAGVSLCMALGSLIGWKVARSALLHLASGGEGKWSAILRRVWPVTVFFGLVTTAVLLTDPWDAWDLGDEFLEFPALSWVCGLSLLWTLLLWGLPNALGSIFQRHLLARHGPLHSTIWLYVLACAVVSPLVLIGTGWDLLVEWSSSEWLPLRIFLVVTIPFGLLTSFVGFASQGTLSSFSYVFKELRDEDGSPQVTYW